MPASAIGSREIERHPFSRGQLLLLLQLAWPVSDFGPPPDRRRVLFAEGINALKDRVVHKAGAAVYQNPSGYVMLMREKNECTTRNDASD